MKKFIFTFPRSHPLWNYYQPIFARDSLTAKAKMLEIYGENWGLQYTEEQWRIWEEEAMKIGAPLQSSLDPIYCKTGQMIIEKVEPDKRCDWCGSYIVGDYENGAYEGVYYHPICYKDATSESYHL